MSKYELGECCEHGRLKRQCDECELLERVAYLEAALREIAKKQGPYSRDPMQHADNCINSMAEIAERAIDETWEPEE